MKIRHENYTFQELTELVPGLQSCSRIGTDRSIETLMRMSGKPELVLAITGQATAAGNLGCVVLGSSCPSLLHLGNHNPARQDSPSCSRLS